MSRFLLLLHLFSVSLGGGKTFNVEKVSSDCWVRWLREVVNNMAQTKLTGKDVLLILLYAPGVTATIAEPIRGRTRLTKMIFLFKEEIYESFRFDKEIDPSKMPTFYGWHYGPFSRDVYSDIDFFVHIGFVGTQDCADAEPLQAEADEFRYWESDLDIVEEEVSEYSEEAICLTALGKSYIEENEVWSRLSENQRQALTEFKRRFADASLYAILKYVYERYPKFTEKSLIKGKIANQV